jgi:hypothetical protein
MPKLSLFRWRLTFAIVSAVAWAAWYWIANEGKPFHVLPIDQDILTLRKALPWLSWTSGCDLVAIPCWIVMGWLLLPWGLNVTLAALILPTLELLRPYRGWRLGIAVSIVDFSALRLIYASAFFTAYMHEMNTDNAAPSVYLWIMRALWAISILVWTWLYVGFVHRSIIMYDPFIRS